MTFGSGNNDATAGIRWNAQVVMPSVAGGSIGVFQLINFAFIYTAPNAGNDQTITSHNETVLDRLFAATSPLYHDFSVSAATGEATAHLMGLVR